MRQVPTTLSYSIDWGRDGRLLVVFGPEAESCCHSRPAEPGHTVPTCGDIDASVASRDRGRRPRQRLPQHLGFDMWRRRRGTGRDRALAPEGDSREVVRGGMLPNGMAITEDGATLIVAESYGRRLTAFDIAADGASPTGASGPTWATACRTGSASTPIRRRLVRRCPEPALRAGAEGGEVLQTSTSTVAVSRACSAATTGARSASSPRSGGHGGNRRGARPVRCWRSRSRCRAPAGPDPRRQPTVARTRAARRDLRAADGSVQNRSAPTCSSTATRPRRSRASAKPMSQTTATSFVASGSAGPRDTSSTVAGGSRRSTPARGSR